MGENKGRKDPLVDKKFDPWHWIGPPVRQKSISRFRKILARLLPKRMTPKASLGGRFDEMDHHQKKLLAKLYHVHRQLETTEEQELYIFKETVVSSLIREGESQQRMLHSSSQTTQVKAFAIYHHWISRCEDWLSHYERDSRDDLLEMIKREIVRDAIEKIIKDQQLIELYLGQSLDQFSLSPSFFDSLYMRIKNRIAPIIHKLEHLKNNLEHLQLGELSTWKGRVNGERECAVDEALDAIDSAIVELRPKNLIEDDEEHQREVVQQVASLERLYPYIVREVDGTELNEEKRRALNERLAMLQHEAYRLSLDLRLPETVADRLQVVINSLLEAQELLGMQEGQEG